MVLSIENHQSPTVAIQVWYHVGGKDDPLSRSGFAHLFEHMMFKSTRNQKNENFDRLTEDVGGANNAFTEEDHTVYHETVPSNYLEPLLSGGSRSNGMNLDVNKANFVSERAVVEEEYRQTYLACPHGSAGSLCLNGIRVLRTPHNACVSSVPLKTWILRMLPDVRKFHETYYRPDNATLIVSGDFEPAQLEACGGQVFRAHCVKARKRPSRESRLSSLPERQRPATIQPAPTFRLPAIGITYLITSPQER